MSSPLLVLGAGQRCGSTLLQRLISSHPDAFIWGEQRGHLANILEAVEGLRAHNEQRGWGGRDEFAKQGYQGFMANLMPEQAVVDAAFEVFCTRLFAVEGARVWGFKEVRYDLRFAEALRRYLPGTRVILVVRDPRSVLCSLDEWEQTDWWTRAKTQATINNWQRIAASFQQETVLPVLTLRYEDYTADPAGTARRVGAFAGLDPAGFDLSVFERKGHNLGSEGHRDLRAWHELPFALRALLYEEPIRIAAKAYDYWIY
jgi:hypothetical protein